MPDTIDWDATYEDPAHFDDDHWLEDGKHIDNLREAVDHWRNLACQEHERAERLAWMLDRHLALNSAYPKVMKEKLSDEYDRREEPTSSPKPRAWPFK